MVTVIIAAKDSEQWIEETFSSLLAQTFEDWECIVSVNGSSDRTEMIAKNITDRRFSLVTSEIPNKSLAVNRALIKSSRDWICILDSDDIWDARKLEKQLAFSKTSKADVIGTQFSYINVDTFDSDIQAPKLPTDHENCVMWLNQRSNPIANSSVMYKKELHDIVGYYDPEKFAIEDYDMWMRSKRAGVRFSNLNEILMKHRLHPSSHYNSSRRQQIYKSMVDEIDRFMIRSKE